MNSGSFLFQPWMSVNSLLSPKWLRFRPSSVLSPLFSPSSLFCCWFLLFLLFHGTSVSPSPIMTFPDQGVYSIFPNEDLRTGRRNFQFDDELLNSNNLNSRNPITRERIIERPRFRARGEASFVKNPLNNDPNNYIVRPLDVANHAALAFDDIDDRQNGGRIKSPNYFAAYRDRNLPFDRRPPQQQQSQFYLPPLKSPPAAVVPSSLLRPTRIHTMSNDLGTPTIHVYDPASQSFVPKNSKKGIQIKTPSDLDKLNVRPGRLLLPGLHNSLSSEEPGPDTFLNHDEYLDYHTNLALDDLAALDRKMKEQKDKKQQHGGGSKNDAKILLFNPGTKHGENDDESIGSVEDGNTSGRGSSLENESGGVEEVTGRSEARTPFVSTSTASSVSSSFAGKFQTSSNTKEIKASSTGTETLLPTDLEVGVYKPILKLPTHLRDEASPSRLLQQAKVKGAAAATTGGGGVVVGTASTTMTTSNNSQNQKAVKSELGTEITKEQPIQLQNKYDDVDIPSSSLNPPLPPIYHQISKSSLINDNNANHSPIEIIPSIVTQSSSTVSGSGDHNHNNNGNGLIDGHFDIVPGVPEAITYHPTPFANNHDGDNNDDDGFDIARFRTETKTPFLYLETKQFSKIKKPGVENDSENNQMKFSSQLNNKKMILVKRIKHLDEQQNSSKSSSSSSTSSSTFTNTKKDYEASMRVHKIQDSSEEKLGAAGHGSNGGGLFSEERATDFNLQLQSQSSSAKGVVSKIHAHVSSCPKLDGPTEVICDVYIRKRHGNLNPHLTVGWKRKFYNETQPDIIVAVNKTLAYEEDFHDKFNVTLAPGISPMLRSVLLIRHVAPADTGNYQCEVSDGENSLKSETLLFLCH